jgi:hypothetical protein
MELDLNTRRAYSEVDEFLNLLPDWQRAKIPETVRIVFKTEKDKTYHKNINPNIPIADQNLLSETLAIIAGLNLKYWATPNERERLIKIYHRNELKWKLDQYQELLKKD